MVTPGGGFAAAAAAAAAAGYNPCPGSRPLANHVPRRYTNPFPTLTLIRQVQTYNIIVVYYYIYYN